MSLNILRQKLEETGIIMSSEQETAFETYAAMLEERNKVMNLTAVKRGKETEVRHFLDSLSPLIYLKDTFLNRVSSYYNNSSDNRKEFCNSKMRIVDLGTGAGFPGIPLAIMLPDVDFVLIDSLHKRIDFLNEVKDTLHLCNVTSICARLEEAGRDHEFREKFDFAVSRAVAELRILIELSVPFLKNDGIFISYKGNESDREVSDSSNAFSELHCHLDLSKKYCEFESGFERSLIVIRKESSCPDRYPRRVGIPSKRPL